jgi:hypothetical protein
MGIMDALNSAQDFLNSNNPLSADQQAQFKSDGFLLPAAFSADGNGLPYTKVPSNHPGELRRNIITWFVPEFGLVRMYINPQTISYENSKVIQRERTKGGYTLQYWGEDFTKINMQGTTGSAGIEGINMLYEIYRAEQYAIDGQGLTMAAANSAADLASKAVNFVGENMFGGGGSLLGGMLGTNNPNNSMATRNVMSLAQLAFTVEMYYNGWVFRGFFDKMTVNEKASDFLIDYTISFIVTQRRGYRVNYFPWSRSAKDGPSQYNTETSFDQDKIQNVKNTFSIVAPPVATPSSKK